jgi:hypothetical protein
MGEIGEREPGAPYLVRHVRSEEPQRSGLPTQPIQLWPDRAEPLGQSQRLERHHLLVHETPQRLDDALNLGGDPEIHVPPVLEAQAYPKRRARLPRILLSSSVMMSVI